MGELSDKSVLPSSKFSVKHQVSLFALSFGAKKYKILAMYANQSLVFIIRPKTYTWKMIKVEPELFAFAYEIKSGGCQNNYNLV